MDLLWQKRQEIYRAAQTKDIYFGNYNFDRNHDRAEIQINTEEGKKSFRNCKLIAGWFTEDCYVFANPFVHQHHTGDSINISIKKEHCLSVIHDGYIVRPVYKPMMHAGMVEKMVVVRGDYLLQFFASYQDLMLPNVDEVEYFPKEVFPKGTVYASSWDQPPRKWLDIIHALPQELQEVERTRHTVSQANRDYHFRVAVLERYDHKCAVCGCDLEYMLEAAHIKSVAAGGTDDPENGVCLCANHHKMYDKGYLELDFKNYEYVIVPEKCDDLWLPTYSAKTKGQFSQRPAICR